MVPAPKQHMRGRAFTAHVLVPKATNFFPIHGLEMQEMSEMNFTPSVLNTFAALCTKNVCSGTRAAAYTAGLKLIRGVLWRIRQHPTLRCISLSNRPCRNRHNPRGIQRGAQVWGGPNISTKTSWCWIREGKGRSDPVWAAELFRVCEAVRVWAFFTSTAFLSVDGCLPQNKKLFLPASRQRRGKPPG